MVAVPYESTGQQLGETRMAMTKKLMEDIEKIRNVDLCKKQNEKYYIMFHAKPYPNQVNLIKIKPFVIFKTKPSMMLSCILFGVDNQKGQLTLEWSLPGDWPTWAVGGTNEPIPETIASIKESGIHYYYEDFLPKDM